MPRVLVVDDEPSIGRTLRINLAARDDEVETVGDGRSALAAVAARVPDVVVLDLGLPDLDGVVVLRRLREDHDGVGLGLAVARGFTEAMGGRLDPFPTTGGGLTVRLTLPAASDDDPGSD